MSRYSPPNQTFHQLRRGIAGIFLLGVAAMLPSAADGGQPDRQGRPPELLGASEKSVSRILGAGQPLVSGLSNEKSSQSHSGGIGSTDAYRTRIGYLGDRSCYAFFMKKTAEPLGPIEVFGLLYLCANHAEWRELEFGGSRVGLIYQATDPKGTPTGQTYLAVLDESRRKLFVYSPDWRPDFNRELWITPDEAPVHRDAERPTGKLPVRSDSKQAELPQTTPFGKSSSAPDPPRVGIDPKQGIYLPQLDQVVPAQPSVVPRAAKRGKRQRRQQRAEPAAPMIGK